MKKQVDELELQCRKLYKLTMFFPFGEDKDLEELIDQLDYELYQASQTIKFIKKHVKDKAKTQTDK